MYEPLFRHAFLPFFESVIKRRPTLRCLAEYEASQWDPPAVLAGRQLARLNALLAHTWQELPFVQGWWREHGAVPPPLRSLAELASYPILTKDFIREHYQQLVVRSPGLRLLTKTTGGSTGTPLRLAYTQDSYAARTALMWRGYRWAGTDIGRRTAYLWGQALTRTAATERKERVYHALFNRLMLNSLAMRDDNLGEYLLALNRFRPRTLVGYTTPLATLARWIVAQGRPVHRPDCVITGAEALHPPQRELIARAFGAPVFDTYGCREFGLLAAQCEAGAMHLSTDHVVFETVDDQGRPCMGQPGHVLVTDLTNRAMPFVRYRLGDVATLGDQAPCRCGRGLPTLSALQGRTLDLIRTRDGRLLPGEFFPILFYDWPMVRRYQVVQPDIDHLDMKLVLEPGHGLAELDGMRARLREALGHSIEIRLQQVDEIARTAEGKLRVTISHVDGLADAGSHTPPN